MPFDGKNFTETKPDVFSLEGLIAWLEKQPQETEYEFSNIHDCLLCRYFRAMGKTDVRIGGRSYLIDGDFGSLPDGLANTAVAIGVNGNRTYASALHRARALQAR